MNTKDQNQKNISRVQTERDEAYQILLFYKYVFIENPEEVMLQERARQEKYSLLGRCIVASEGINFTVEGKKEDTEKYIKELEHDSRFLDIHFKKSIGTGHAFPRRSIKVRSEIVSAHLGTCDIDPNQQTGIRLKPEGLHQWFAENKEFYIVDMRNAYEHKVGHFEGSLTPAMYNFRDLPDVARQIAHLKDKTVLTVCTGGVRCEKASGYLLVNGFTDVYQLDGGIVSYMEKYPNEDFKGKLYVFDGRIVMGFYTDDVNHTVISTCDACGILSENYVNCADDTCHNHMVVCEGCLEKCDYQPKCKGGCTYSRHGKKIPAKRSFKESFKNFLRKAAAFFKK